MIIYHCLVVQEPEIPVRNWCVKTTCPSACSRWVLTGSLGQLFRGLHGKMPARCEEK